MNNIPIDLFDTPPSKKMEQFDASMLDNLFTTTVSKNDAMESIPSREALELHKNAEVDIGKVYSELEQLISVGKESLDIVQYHLKNAATGEDAGQVLAGTASLIKSVHGIVKEFNAINSSKINHERKIQLELLKQQHKLELMRAKNSVDVKATPDGMVVYTQEDIVASLLNEGIGDEIDEQNSGQS